jgi:hypothetical protein
MARPMRVAPYLSLLRHNPAFSRLYAAQLISLWGLAGAGWIWFSRPVLGGPIDEPMPPTAAVGD